MLMDELTGLLGHFVGINRFLKFHIWVILPD
jgi:hypothetical protein